MIIEAIGTDLERSKNLVYINRVYRSMVNNERQYIDHPSYSILLPEIETFKLPPLIVLLECWDNDDTLPEFTIRIQATDDIEYKISTKSPELSRYYFDHITLGLDVREHEVRKHFPELFI